MEETTNTTPEVTVDPTVELMRRQLKTMKLQTAMLTIMLVILIGVGSVLSVLASSVVGRVNQLDMPKINSTISMLETKVAELQKIDVDTINETVVALKDAANGLAEVDIDAINKGVAELTAAAQNLQGLDMKEMNDLITSLQTVSTNLEKSTSVISKIFGR